MNFAKLSFILLVATLCGCSVVPKFKESPREDAAIITINNPNNMALIMQDKDGCIGYDYLKRKNKLTGESISIKVAPDEIVRLNYHEFHGRMTCQIHFEFMAEKNKKYTIDGNGNIQKKQDSTLLEKWNDTGYEGECSVQIHDEENTPIPPRETKLKRTFSFTKKDHVCWIIE